MYIESCIHYVYRKGFKTGIQNVYMILNAENVKCIHFVYIIVYIIYTAMYTLCTFSCIHFVCITSVRASTIHGHSPSSTPKGTNEMVNVSYPEIPRPMQAHEKDSVTSLNLPESVPESPPQVYETPTSSLQVHETPTFS